MACRLQKWSACRSSRYVHCLTFGSSLQHGVTHACAGGSTWRRRTGGHAHERVALGRVHCVRERADRGVGAVGLCDAGDDPRHRLARSWLWRLVEVGVVARVSVASMYVTHRARVMLQCWPGGGTPASARHPHVHACKCLHSPPSVVGSHDVALCGRRKQTLMCLLLPWLARASCTTLEVSVSRPRLAYVQCRPTRWWQATCGVPVPDDVHCVCACMCVRACLCVNGWVRCRCQA